MTQTAYQLDLAPPRAPLIVAAETLLADLEDGWPLTRTGVSTVLSEAYGGTDASGAWGQAKAAALSAFEGTKQRFFAQLLLSMKLPSLCSRSFVTRPTRVGGYEKSGMTLRGGVPSGPAHGFEAKDAPASAALAEARNGLDTSWCAGATKAERFALYRDLSDETRAGWLGMVVARTLEATRGFAAPRWLTYNQCQALGGHIRHGQKASHAIFYKSYAAETDDGDTETRRVLRAYPVFNAEQCADLPPQFLPPIDNFAPPEGQRAEVDDFFERLPAQVRHHGDEAYYEPARDRITLPPVERFNGFDQYYATRAHELAHWTGHASRLARDMSGRFKARAYAAEELVAELASAIVGAELGLPVGHLDDHASYIADWIALLKDDPRAMLTAAARAEDAASLLFQLGGRGLSAGDDAGHGEALS